MEPKVKYGGRSFAIVEPYRLNMEVDLVQSWNHRLNMEVDLLQSWNHRLNMEVDLLQSWNHR
jgi:hypothetical protein